MSDATVIPSHPHEGRLDNSIDAPRRSKRGRSPREGDALPHRRGAPLGNQNNLKHGYYTKKLVQGSLCQYDEAKMRNLLGEVAMLKDYMYKIYTENFDSTDPVVLADTLRALSLATMAMARALLVHNQVRILGPNSPQSLPDLLSSLDAAAGNLSHLDQ